MSSDFDDEPSLDLEDVERRSDVRGIFRDVAATFPDGVTLPVREGSRKGFFVETDDPDRFRLGEVLEITLSHEQISFSCRMEVVRKEIHPRRGLVIRVVYITPAAEDTLRKLLDSL